VVSYTCDTGYGLIGVGSQTCDGSDSSTEGTWTGSPPACEGNASESVLILFVHSSNLIIDYKSY